MKKITVPLRDDQIVAIEQMQVDHRAKTGEKVTKIVLVQRAVDLLIEQTQS